MATLDFSKQHLKKSALAFVFIVSFLLELAAFASFGLIADILPIDGKLQDLLWLALVVGVIYFWATYMAPKAKKRLDWGKYYPAKAAIYAVSAISIYWHLNATWAAIFVTLSIVVEAVLYPYRNINLQTYFGNPKKGKKNGKRRTASSK